MSRNALGHHPSIGPQTGKNYQPPCLTARSPPNRRGPPDRNLMTANRVSTPTLFVSAVTAAGRCPVTVHRSPVGWPLGGGRTSPLPRPTGGVLFADARHDSGETAGAFV